MRAALLRTTMLSLMLLPAAAPADPPAPDPGEAAPAAGCATSGHWAAPTPEKALELSSQVANWISVAPDGALFWNGVPITPERAAQYLAITREMIPQPLLVLNQRPGTDCETFARTAAYVEKHVSCDPENCRLAAGHDHAPLEPPAPPAPPRHP